MDIRVMFSNTNQDDLQSSYRGCTFSYINVADEVRWGKFSKLLADAYLPQAAFERRSSLWVAHAMDEGFVGLCQMSLEMTKA